MKKLFGVILVLLLSISFMVACDPIDSESSSKEKQQDALMIAGYADLEAKIDDLQKQINALQIVVNNIQIQVNNLEIEVTEINETLIVIQNNITNLYFIIDKDEKEFHRQFCILQRQIRCLQYAVHILQQNSASKCWVLQIAGYLKNMIITNQVVMQNQINFMIGIIAQLKFENDMQWLAIQQLRGEICLLKFAVLNLNYRVTQLEINAATKTWVLQQIANLEATLRLYIDQQDSNLEVLINDIEVVTNVYNTYITNITNNIEGSNVVVISKIYTKEVGCWPHKQTKSIEVVVLKVVNGDDVKYISMEIVKNKSTKLTTSIVTPEVVYTLDGSGAGLGDIDFKVSGDIIVFL